jgi:hypothetical protein
MQNQCEHLNPGAGDLGEPDRRLEGGITSGAVWRTRPERPECAHERGYEVSRLPTPRTNEARARAKMGLHSGVCVRAPCSMVDGRWSMDRVRTDGGVRG